VSKTPWLWILWLVTTTAMAGYLTYRLRGPDRRAYLPGPTSHGHYQIELNCNACHTPWMGVKEQACIDCHGAELKAANDSHPKNKFTDPRNADRLNILAADNCITCHREHVPEQTRAMGVTMPMDYCYHCHQETLEERVSHKGFAFDSCATAGCHNYHDNTALYEDFLAKHAEEPKFKEPASRPVRDLLAYLNESGEWRQQPALTAPQLNAPAEVKPDAKLLHAWESTAHAKAAVNCNDCHMVEEGLSRLPTGFGPPESKTLARQSAQKVWSDKPDHIACARCHEQEVEGFLASRHGMRLAQGLSPMTPALARLPMKREAMHRELSCASCHGAHEFETRAAAVESCLSCHNDDHSLAYQASPHFALWQAELKGEAPAGTGVSCATCHLPRETHKVDGVARVLVQHNQNHNLRPNEKMIRSVCIDCHGVEFSIDALADAALVRTNFTGRPSRHVESIDLVVRRMVETRNRKSNQ
jgi:hypothetical protein